ncbi:hypothetical protein IM40_02960 [Candidatus Paracaedimonas acanthamoebae]|nr:hypothetical protein IM40_02960 [Candidatus Paracaedimonas acanthamoebae]
MSPIVSLQHFLGPRLRGMTSDRFLRLSFSGLSQGSQETERLLPPPSDPFWTYLAPRLSPRRSLWRSLGRRDNKREAGNNKPKLFNPLYPPPTPLLFRAHPLTFHPAKKGHSLKKSVHWS